MTTGNPLLSVVVPSRNRLHLVRHSILSLQISRVRDAEFVISDNSDEDLGRELRALAGNDRRFKFVRPPSVLTMGDHWAWALSHCKGRYIGVLTDRCAFHRGSLDAMASFLRSAEVDGLIYDHSDALRFMGRFILRRKNSLRRKPIECVDPDEVTRSLSRGEIDPGSIPRLMNGFVHHKVMKKLFEGDASAIKSENPDYAAGISILSLNYRKILRINRPMMFSYGLEESNGAAVTSGRSNKAKIDFINERHVALSQGIISGIINFANAVFHEYNRVRSRGVGNLPPIDEKRAAAAFLDSALNTLISSERERQVRAYDVFVSEKGIKFGKISLLEKRAYSFLRRFKRRNDSIITFLFSFLIYRTRPYENRHVVFDDESGIVRSRREMPEFLVRGMRSA